RRAGRRGSHLNGTDHARRPATAHRLRPGRFEAPRAARPDPSDESAQRHRRNVPPVPGVARPGQARSVGSGLRLHDVENKNDASLARACCKVGLDRTCRRDAEMPVVLRQGLAGPPPTEARKRDSPPLRAAHYPPPLESIRECRPQSKDEEAGREGPPSACEMGGNLREDLAACGSKGSVPAASRALQGEYSTAAFPRSRDLLWGRFQSSR